MAALSPRFFSNKLLRITLCCGPSIALVCASGKNRHYSGNMALIRILSPLVVPICAKRSHRCCSGQPALLNRHYRATPAAVWGKQPRAEAFLRQRPPPPSLRYVHFLKIPIIGSIPTGHRVSESTLDGRCTMLFTDGI